MHIRIYLAIACGGGFGSLIRFIGTEWIPSSTTFPIQTLVLNLFGCFLYTFLFFGWFKQSHAHPVWEKAVLTGAIGSMTTFSTFTLDFMRLASYFPWQSCLYMVLTVIGGLLMTVLGKKAGEKRWTSS